nr:unnamed protein product [Digitaria exilis]
MIREEEYLEGGSDDRVVRANEVWRLGEASVSEEYGASSEKQTRSILPASEKIGEERSTSPPSAGSSAGSVRSAYWALSPTDLAHKWW